MDLGEAIIEAERRLGVEFKGWRVLPLCGVCLTEYEPLVFSLSDGVDGFLKAAVESPFYGGYGVFIPGTREQAEKTDYHVVVYAICRGCQAFLERDKAHGLMQVESNILSLSRFVKLVKVRL